MDSQIKKCDKCRQYYQVKCEIEHQTAEQQVAFPKNLQLHEEGHELIYITHIVDPHNFFVQRACHQSIVKDMLPEFCNAVSLPTPSVSDIDEGNIYLVFNQARNFWQRCRIVSIDRQDVNKPIFRVFCIDFGSTEEVSLDKLRVLPPAPASVAAYPLAIHCSLANVRPSTGAWSSDDACLFQDIIDNKQAVIYIRHIRATSNDAATVECDVTTYDDGISIAHALVFHERAELVNPRLPYPKIQCSADKPKIRNSDMKPNTVEMVFITHIISSEKFYVRKRHVQEAYEQLFKDMDQEYSLSVNEGSIYLPEIGMACAVNVEEHRETVGNVVCGSWARGWVTELAGQGRVRVLLADCGVSALVPWTALRRLHPRHATQAAAATECHLAGVTILDEKWICSSGALLEKFKDRLLELQVEYMKRNSVGVILYDKSDKKNVICINTEMIKQEFAVSFGLYNFNKFNQIPAVEQACQNRNRMPLKRVRSDDAEVTASKKSRTYCEDKDKVPLRLEAKLLHYQSPSLFYVSLCHMGWYLRQQKRFNELCEKMQKFYSNNNKGQEKQWAVDERCCTFCCQSQTWRRAIIVEIEGANAKVIFSDFACSETVPVASLRELTPEFGISTRGDSVLKGHMFGVTPADGAGAGGREWPTATKEYLKGLLDTYPKIFITKLRSSFDGDSVPLEVWVKHTIQGSASEPNTVELRSLNKMIIEQGLGVPDKNLPGSSSGRDNTDDVTLIKNVTSSVHDCLQLEEPIPTKPLGTNPQLSSPNTHKSSSHCNDQDAANEMIASKVTDWLPPVPLQNMQFFTGMPTYVDSEGVLYVHDVSQQGMLELIRNALNARFKQGQKDPKAEDNKWAVGEPCIAMSSLDSQFYRGRVLKVNEEAATCLIHYIDYGKEETCAFQNLRKSITIHQIPTLAHKCVLHRIKPKGGAWDRNTLDYIHKSVVKKECYIKITGEPYNGITPIDLMCDTLWINDHLVDVKMAVYTDGSKQVTTGAGR